MTRFPKLSRRKLRTSERHVRSEWNVTDTNRKARFYTIRARESITPHSVRHLKSLGISLRSATEPIDDTSTGKLMEGVLASFAQFDNDVRSDRTRAGMRAALELGRWTFPAPHRLSERAEMVWQEPGAGPGTRRRSSRGRSRNSQRDDLRSKKSLPE